MPKPIKKRVVKKGKAEEEIKSKFEDIRGYYAENAQKVYIILAILLVLIVGAVGFFFYIKKTTEEANVLHREAYNSYSAAIAKDDLKLFQESLDKFQKAWNRKKSPLRQYYIADIQYRIGELDKAIETLKSLTGEYRAEPSLLSLGYNKLGMLYMAKQDYDNALKTFDRLYTSDAEVYKDVALYQKSRIYKELSQEDESLKALEELAKLFPDSPYAQEAEAQLKAKKEKSENKKEGKGDEEKKSK